MKSSRLLPLIVACGLFVENMDSTVLSTSLPAIAADLATDPIALKLALTTYLLALAVFVPVSGWVADRFGARTTFVSAIAVFLLGSVGCALSDSLGTLVAGRFVQGMGGAMMVPVGRLVCCARSRSRRSWRRSRGSRFLRSSARWSGRRSAVSSRPISIGVGSSSSTCRSARSE
jgi:MFS family permease